MVEIVTLSVLVSDLYTQHFMPFSRNLFPNFFTALRGGGAGGVRHLDVVSLPAPPAVLVLLLLLRTERGRNLSGKEERTELSLVQQVLSQKFSFCEISEGKSMKGNSRSRTTTVASSILLLLNSA